MPSRRRRRTIEVPAIPESNAPATPKLAYITGSASETVVDALIDDPSSWQRTPDGSLYYGDTNRTFVSIGDPRIPSAAVNAEEAFNRVLEVGGDEAAQTLLFIMARCLSNDNPFEKVRITVNDSLSFRGLKRHKSGDYRPEQKRAAARQFRLFSDIWVTARDQVEVKSGRGTRMKNINVTSRLIEVAVETEEEAPVKRGGNVPLPSIVSANSNDTPYAMRAGLGEWAKPYVDTPDSVKRILHTIVQYDVTEDTQRFAMRFSLAIMFRRVSDAVTVGELLESSRIPVPKRRADHFKESVEEAFEFLRRDGLISSWSYDIEDQTLPLTRWMNKWLQWPVRFTAPIGPLASGKA